MSDWWADRLGVPASPPPARPDPGPWWKPAPRPAPAPPPAPAPDPAGLRGKPVTELTTAEADILARAGLAARAGQDCPNCGSGNYVPAGTKIGGTVMPTSKCFECGGSTGTYASSPEPAPPGRGRSGNPARQIDTGGGAGSMFMKFTGVPDTYRPRG